ncbi:MAG: M48 family metallopeptidase [Candidatus Nomurabacteria bacterium]|jgi:predicted metal-dependent hydrolase|nr:M48 family metallopeptidase [Candidatus Nomurabacteria bacterium]
MIIEDEDFGAIAVRRVDSRYIRLKIDEHGQVSASLPRYATVRSLRKFIDHSRVSLKKSIAKIPKAAKKLSEVERKKLKKRAEFYLKRRLFALASEHGLKYQRVRIMNAKTRWGSCSSTGTISLNYALMLAPTHLRDYVMLHELTHTLFMNHSREFWGKLGQFYPDYKQARKEIKKYSPYL